MALSDIYTYLALSDIYTYVSLSPHRWLPCYDHIAAHHEVEPSTSIEDHQRGSDILQDSVQRESLFLLQADLSLTCIYVWIETVMLKYLHLRLGVSESIPGRPACMAAVCSVFFFLCCVDGVFEQNAA